MGNLNIVAKTGTYKKKDGTEKAIWKTLGSLVEQNGKRFITLDASFNPAALERKEDGKVYLSLFEPKSKHESGFYNDEVPF